MKFIVSSFIFLVIWNSGFSQEKPFNIYAKAGIQAGGPIYHSETIVSKSGAPGFNPLGGLGVSYNLSKELSVSLEAFYSRRKVTYQSTVKDQWYRDNVTVFINNQPYVYEVETIFTGKSKGEFDIQYIEIPLNLHYKIASKWSLQTGAYYARALSRKNKGTATGIVGRTDIPEPNTVDHKEYDYSSHVNKYFYGVTIGAQYSISPRVSADLRSTFSFKSLYNETWDGLTYRLRDLYLQLSVNYYFHKRDI
ncbi:MAG: PorT family protein [Sporocytophaga sp.]|uniref:porin family protein n=1 Tax=Sporocytophaga sp. TaxID=2231183 RepID=UPI001AFD754F|nr:porin family protein [Sporocytophaga sp.]MBO9698845.1 PorT family protein [Sporocytophaga sp.]